MTKRKPKARKAAPPASTPPQVSSSRQTAVRRRPVQKIRSGALRASDSHAKPADASSGSAPAVRAPDVRHDARIVGLFGATGSGKSETIKRTLEAVQPGRTVIIFDTGHEYTFGRVTENEIDFLSSCVEGAHLTFRPSFNRELRQRQFDRFSKAALDICRATGQCVVIVEELEAMVEPGWGPDYWCELTKQGRKIGASVVAASQRPAQVDKDFWSNASHIRTGRLNFADDQATLARSLNVPVSDVQALYGTRYIERSMLTGTPAVHGEITF